VWRKGLSNPLSTSSSPDFTPEVVVKGSGKERKKALSVSAGMEIEPA
jgi:hypothetical protein